MAKNRRNLVANSDPFAGPSGPPSLQELTNSMVTSNQSELIDTDVYRDDSGNLIAYNFRLTPLGIDPTTFDQNEDAWMKLAEWLFQMEGRLSLFIGDLLVGMEVQHGVTYEKVAEHFGRSVKTLYNWKYVCESVDISLRRENLTYSHYMLVAGMNLEAQEKYLTMASEQELSKAQLKKIIDEDNNENSLASQPSKLERNIENILIEINENRWEKFGKNKRQKYYQSLKALITQMENWGID